jgi:hypothetical protein
MSKNAIYLNTKGFHKSSLIDENTRYKNGTGNNSKTINSRLTLTIPVR